MHTRVAASVGAIVLAAACGSHSAESWLHDAVQCTLYAQTNDAPFVLGSSTQRTLTVTRGEHGSVELAPLTMRTSLGADGFGVWVTHGNQQIFRGLYQFGAPFPENQFLGDHGFTGLIYLDVPGVVAGYQLICKAVSSGADPDRGNKYRTQRERETTERIAALESKLRARDSSLRARGDALVGLHKLRQRSFPGLQLAGANLDRADLRESHMPDARFTGASLQGAQLYFNHFERADFMRANLQRANLYSVMLEGANLREANLRGVSLERAKLAGAGLASADLTGAYLWYASLEGADLSNANLERANLEGADLRRANLRGANLRGAWLKNAKLQGAKLEGALNLTPEQLARAQIE